MFFDNLNIYVNDYLLQFKLINLSETENQICFEKSF